MNSVRAERRAGQTKGTHRPPTTSRFTAGLSLALVTMSVFSFSQEHPGRFMMLREQAAVQQEWVRARLDKVLPELMRESDAAMWILSMREFNEDPVFSSIVAPTTMSARRRTIFIFFDRGPGKGVERIALGGGSQGGLYATVRDTGTVTGELSEAEQWRLLRKIVEDRNPRTIAVNISPTHAFADGLSASEWDQLRAALGTAQNRKIVQAERLAVELIEVRLPEMLPVYRHLMQWAHAIIEEAFSRTVITPGKTRTDDVAWWMRQRALNLGFAAWFHPSVDIQRRKSPQDEDVDTSRIIQRGDLLHCDFGISAMRLNTDTQHMAYVLREGESDAPEGLKHALRRSNRLQDLLLGNMRAGRTGNDILMATLEQMRAEGIEGSVYSHPIGEHGHGAGPLIGLWDRQEPIPGRGDLPVRRNSWYSIELQATTMVPEWGNQPVRSAQEEDACVDADGSVRWVLARQGQLHLIR